MGLKIKLFFSSIVVFNFIIFNKLVINICLWKGFTNVMRRIFVKRHSFWIFFININLLTMHKKAFNIPLKNQTISDKSIIYNVICIHKQTAHSKP